MYRLFTKQTSGDSFNMCMKEHLLDLEDGAFIRGAPLGLLGFVKLEGLGIPELKSYKLAFALN